MYVWSRSVSPYKKGAESSKNGQNWDKSCAEYKRSTVCLSISSAFIVDLFSRCRITGYLDNSPHSKQSGLRIFCSNQVPGFFQNWNPWYDEMPYISLTSHVQSVLVESPPEAVQHSLFCKALINAITNARETEPNKEILSGFEVVEAELEIYVYTGLSAKIYNQSKLGFYKHRGSILFWQCPF